jgi:4'-phosphopantetheinyl transferase
VGDPDGRDDRPLTTVRPPQLADSEVHVWSFSLGEAARGERRALARARRAEILGGYLGTDAGERVVAAAPGGKPMLADGGVQFNLSHCGTLAVLAVARSLAVGIDLERRRESIDLGRCIRDRCSDREGRAVMTAADPYDEWVRLWTRKEAVVKADGTGVLDQLDRVDVLEELVLGIDGALDGRWRCLDLEPDPSSPGLHLALALPADVDGIRVIRQRA